MRPKLYHRFKTLGYDLECKICECPITQFDEVESKSSSGSKGPKLYHAECYDRFHLQFEEGKIYNGYGDEIESEGKVEEKKE